MPLATAAHGYEMCYVHVLRDYLQREFQGADWSKVRQGFVLDRVISDFIFLCFFVGNDFLPHMPALEIRDGAVDALLELYKTSISTRLGGYLTSGGEVALGRVEALLQQVGELESLIFQQRRSEEAHGQRRREQLQAQRRLDDVSSLERDIARTGAYQGQAAAQRSAALPPPAVMGRSARVLAGKTVAGGDGSDMTALAGEKRGREGGKVADDEEELDGGSVGGGGSAAATARAAAAAAAAAVSARVRGDMRPFGAVLDDAQKNADAALKEELEEGGDLVRLGEPGWKDRYYQHKLGVGMGDDEKRREVAAEYVKGLCWVLRYYYGTNEGKALPNAGVPSWTWYYPFHYAPPASDLIGLVRLEKACRGMTLGEPFSPLMQLMAVLPPQSAHALPGPLRELMTTATSPIADFYPTTFKQDLNGAHAAWKAVPLLPFIEQDRLRREVETAKSALRDEARARNRFGPIYMYVAPEDSLARELWALAEANKHLDGYEITRIMREPEADRSLALLLSPYHSVPKGGTRGAPCSALAPVSHNGVASAVVKLPQTRAHAPCLPPGAVSPRSVLADRDWPVKDRDGLRLLQSWEAARGGGADTSWGARRGGDGGPSPGGAQRQQQQQQQQRWD